MIISRTPFRVSYLGGGSDIKAFYEQYTGLVVSQAIDKYMYITVSKHFSGLVKASYSRVEEVKHFSEIQHPLIRACLEYTGIINNISIASQSDIPAGTGLGSSSSFTVGLLNALYAFKGTRVTPETLAQQACEIEIEICKSPIGKQDQYAAAYGGLNYIEFNKDGSVNVTKEKTLSVSNHLLANCLFFYLDLPPRDANVILSEQSKATKEDDKVVCSLISMVNEARLLSVELKSLYLDSFGQRLRYSWELKRSLALNISSPKIDEYCSLAYRAGAVGYKVLGAGGSGFLLVYASPNSHENIRKALSPLQVYKFNPSHKGSSIIYDSSS